MAFHPKRFIAVCAGDETRGAARRAQELAQGRAAFPDNRAMPKRATHTFESEKDGLSDAQLGLLMIHH